MTGAGKRVRRAALALTAVLVVFVVFGGAVHLVKETNGEFGGGSGAVEGSPFGGLANAGLGLCAATVAVLAGARNLERTVRHIKRLFFPVTAVRTSSGTLAPDAAGPGPLRVGSCVARLRVLQTFRL